MLEFLISLARVYHAKRGSAPAQTLVEYGLLLALIAIIVVVALLFLGPLVSEMFTNVGNRLNDTP